MFSITTQKGLMGLLLYHISSSKLVTIFLSVVIVVSSTYWIESLLSNICRNLVLRIIFVGILKVETFDHMKYLKIFNVKQNSHYRIQFKKLSCDILVDLLY